MVIGKYCNVSDECDCSCHTSDGRHVIPCCGKCSFCGKRIKRDFFDNHLEQCSKVSKPEEFPERE